jgi:hypothetical protein
MLQLPQRGCLAATRRQCPRRVYRSSRSTAQCTAETASSVFEGFIQQAGATTSLELQPSLFDNGLFATAAATKGEASGAVPPMHGTHLHKGRAGR